MNDFFQHGSTSDYSHSNGGGSDFLVGLLVFILLGFTFVCPIIGAPILFLIASSKN